jgi:hypothetical protein
VPDAADQGRVGPGGQIVEGRVARFARQAGQADLDEFVIPQRPLGFGDHAGADAGSADENQGFQGVGEAAQVAALFFGKLHGPDSTAFSMPKRTRSSHAWLKEHFTDPYVLRAKAEGWRSRAIYKLEEMDRKEKLLKQGMVVLDLGAAPGSWSQYARRKVGRHGRVVAMDILPMDAIMGVEFMQGDFREESVMEALIASVGERGVDVLLSDIAPNLSGMDAIDQPRSMYLVSWRSIWPSES